MKCIRFVLAAALAASTFAWTGPAQAATPAITQEDCDNAWSDAQASESCTATVTAINPNDPPDGNLYLCDVSASCATVDASHERNSSTSYRGPPAGGVDELVNCSGALAKTCPEPFSIIQGED